MGVPIVVADVVSSALSRLHLPTLDAGGFITPTHALDYVRSSLERLSGLMTKLYGDDYWTRRATMGIQAGVDLVSVPANFGVLVSLQWQLPEKVVNLEMAPYDEYDPVPVEWSERRPPKYRLEGASFVLTPIPDRAYTLRVKYTTGLFIEDLADTVDGQLGWREWLIYDLMEQFCDREEKSGDRWYAKRKELEQQLTEQAEKRTRYAPAQVRDPRGTLNRDNRAARRSWLWRG